MQSMHIPLLILQYLRVISYCFSVHIELSIGVGPVIVSFYHADWSDLKLIGVVFDCLFIAA